jgi:hypothetical protein
MSRALPQTKLPHQDATKIEEIVQEGCRILHLTPGKPQYAEVARQLSKKHSITVSYFTLRNHYLGKSQPHRGAHEHQQSLSAEQENVLVDWIHHLSSSGHPLTKQTIRKKAEDICGKKPSPNWVPLFLHRHPDIKLGQPSGLDPKRAHIRKTPNILTRLECLQAA